MKLHESFSCLSVSRPLGVLSAHLHASGEAAIGSHFLLPLDLLEARGRQQWEAFDMLLWRRQEISYLHTAIRSAMQSFTSEAKALKEKREFSSAQLSALVDRHRFLRSVCSYHSASEDEVLFPALRCGSGGSSLQRCLVGGRRV